MIHFSAPSAVQLFRRRLVATTLSWLVLTAHVLLLSGCNYYRNKTQEAKPEEITRLAESKVFLIHQGTTVWQLNNPQLNEQTLVGQKAALTPELKPYADSIPHKPLKYKSAAKKQVLNLVHIYVTDIQVGEGQQVRIPVAAMQRLDVVEADTGRTILSYTLGAIGIALGVFVVIAVIALLTKSSCPFVYAYDGQHYRFVGEAYGGAIFAPSERDDYMPLPAIRPAGGQYQVKITNELRERQYTNVAELWVVRHADSVQVLLDKTGGVQTIMRPQVPIRAVSQTRADYTPTLAATDHNAFLFNEETAAATPNSLTLSFANPTKAKTGKLVLHAQNSLWLDYLYGEFTKKFGSYYNKWALTQRQVSAEELNQWSVSQSIPLKISVKTAKGWQLVDNIPTVGPLAARDLVVPFALPEGLASEQVQLRLETGFMFWELDYAAVDFSPNQPVRLEKCRPWTARDEIGRDQRTNLAQIDGQYLQQLHPGTEATLTYRAAPLAPSFPAPRTTVFLHTRGYYEHIRQYEGLPNLPELYSFRQPGRFVEFSREKYQQFYQVNNQAVAKANP